MKRSLINGSLLLVVCAGLSACSTMMSSKSQGITEAEGPEDSKMGIMSGEQVAQGGAIGGNLEGSMDESDKSKLSKALDGGLGKSTHWVNGGSGISYTVTPKQKVTVGDNSFCRTYTVTAEKNGQSSNMSGTACLASDGAWHRV